MKNAHEPSGNYGQCPHGGDFDPAVFSEVVHYIKRRHITDQIKQERVPEPEEK